jgi:hypothetical protein
VGTRFITYSVNSYYTLTSEPYKNLIFLSPHIFFTPHENILNEIAYEWVMLIMKVEMVKKKKNYLDLSWDNLNHYQHSVGYAISCPNLDFLVLSFWKPTISEISITILEFVETNQSVSNRTRKTKNGSSISLKVSASTSIYQLKMMIWEFFVVSQVSVYI